MLFGSRASAFVLSECRSSSLSVLPSDWQRCTHGQRPRDLAYAISIACSIEDRRLSAFWTVTLSPPPGLADTQPRDIPLEFIKRIAALMDGNDMGVQCICARASSKVW